MTGKKPAKTKKNARKPAAAPARTPGYLGELKALIALVAETGISELEVQSGGRTFRIGKSGRALYAEPPPVAHNPGPAPAAAAPAESTSYVAIKSPIVGTFYRAPAPDADPYAEEGQRVSIGQTVCIIEAMKLMNEIQSEVSGRVVRILAQNGQPVEYGQEIFLVDPES